MLERDVTLATLYETPAVLILRHQSGPHTAEVIVHTLSGPGQAPVKSHVLKLGLSGRFAINVVDDLILVHHQVCIYNNISGAHQRFHEYMKCKTYLMKYTSGVKNFNGI